jgi:hypothetical protein
MQMMFGILKWVRSIAKRGLWAASTAISRLTKPIPRGPALETVADFARSKPQLVAENLLLRQQLIVLNRSVKRPRVTPAERGLFVLIASRLQSWKETQLIVKPETVLRWHRQGYRLFWMRKSHTRSHEPKLPAETITLIKQVWCRESSVVRSPPMLASLNNCDQSLSISDHSLTIFEILHIVRF